MLADKMHSELGGMNRYNTMQDFFNIELQNEQMRDELHEVQSTFTVTDQQLLEVQQDKVYAETEYDNYRAEAQSNIHLLVEEVKDKEIELQRLQNKINNQSYLQD